MLSLRDKQGQLKYKDEKSLRTYVAYSSAHETGMALDFGNNGLKVDVPSNERMKETKFYQWLKANAHRFGFTPYKNEAWHWECRLPRESWVSGEEFIADGNFAVRIEKPGEGGAFPRRNGSLNQPCRTQMKDHG